MINKKRITGFIFLIALFSLMIIIMPLNYISGVQLVLEYLLMLGFFLLIVVLILIVIKYGAKRTWFQGHKENIAISLIAVNIALFVLLLASTFSEMSRYLK